MPIESAKKAWNDSIGATIAYPSILESNPGTTKFLMATIDAVEVNGVGHPHELRHGMASHSQVMVTRRNDGQGGRMIVAETEPALAMLLFLARTDQFFDVILEEIEDAQNAGRGQWELAQATLMGCKINPMDFRYDGDLPFVTAPFTWMRYVDKDGNQMGDGLFSITGVTPPQGDS